MRLSSPDSVASSASSYIRWRIDHACHIDKLTFKVLVLLMACFAVLASISRLVFRLRQDRKLLLDDWLILFGTVCLIAETGCVYDFAPTMYLIDAAIMKKDVYDWISLDKTRFQALAAVGPAWVDASLTLAWVTVFSVKFSFLTLFHRMILNVRRALTIYYWITVVATAVAGIVVILESFILCPHFGAASAQCFLQNNYTFGLGTGIICQCLDIATDLMIMAIPILLLRLSQLRLNHKLRIAMVLCLSCVCVILSIVRLAGGVHRNIKGVLQFGIVWITFMLHCEAAVAIIAGSIPALDAIYRTHQKRRTLCATTSTQDLRESAEKPKLKSKVSDALKNTKESLAVAVPQRSASRLRHSLPALPTFPLSPLRILRRPSQNTETQYMNPCQSPTPSSNSSIIAPVKAYHDFQKEQQRNEIRVTYECTVMSEAASLHDLSEFSEVGRQEWVWQSDDSTKNDEEMGMTDRDVITQIDPALIGRIGCGMMV